ncbi:BnaC01g19200D [Brassica napus]|uniref:BnaC01g19200D protein n=1 Tax=Brassica napus TaxID=3708 RepID=A0A078GXB7_BRANA|nr:BnaC01g19200D [Brassica napus]
MVSKEFFHLLPKNSESQSVTDRTLLLHLKVRFLRYWEARNVRRGGELMGVDMLRLDSQEDDPTIPVVKLFPSGEFPEAICGEQHLKRREIWSVWTKANIQLFHSQVRKYVRSIVKPGMLTTDVCETLEDTVRKLISENGLKAGITFPTGCSLNWVAAHWTPNSGDKTVLQYDDVMKVDFATHIDEMAFSSPKAHGRTFRCC